MRVRPATLDDLPAILEIYNEAALNTTATADATAQTLEERRQWYDARVDNGYPIFVAELPDSTIAGWSSYGVYYVRAGYRFTAEVSVYIHADHRGKGIGTALMPPLIDAAKVQSIHSLLSRIDASNVASIKLHERFGFIRTGYLREVIYKFDRWLDVVYMQRMIDHERPPNAI